MQKQKEANEKLVAIMKDWQAIEEKSINSIHRNSKKIKNPLVKQILKIIVHDSSMHRVVQQFIINTLEKKAVSLSPEELGEVWTVINDHLKMERATILLGQRAKQASRNFIHQYLINYILTDEQKHEKLLEALDNIKKNMYPYG